MILKSVVELPLIAIRYIVATYWVRPNEAIVPNIVH